MFPDSSSFSDNLRRDFGLTQGKKTAWHFDVLSYGLVTFSFPFAMHFFWMAVRFLHSESAVFVYSPNISQGKSQLTY